MKQGRITVEATIEGWFPVGEGEFEVTISRGSIQHSLRFYGSGENWRTFGNRLLDFPLSVKDQVQFEMGSNNSALMLVAYCYDEKGHIALRVVMNANEDEPHSCQLAFSIPAEAASINQLGFLLSNWQATNGSEITWEAQTS
ncbi:hypothetical protein [Hymenobacter convexus]|uniref:hypothetical protein n=1 Tax=Hymenobacter sp. CA1UV-4 TaxID=3063782 RepID=UPI0027137419|nr:hypothetical protein [Hymenobacter sp. CA1UV-4]MDO7852790.1 hypothetical protein [Hymenobacter sp. CA1UV-4]